MEKKNSALHKSVLTLTWCFYAVLLAVMLYGLYYKNWRYVFISLSIGVLIALPFIADHYARRKDFIIPGIFKIVYMFYILLTIFLGDMFRFYKKFLWWDDALHFLSGILLFIIGVYVVHVVNIKDKGTTITGTFFITLFAFSFTLMLGKLWEIGEFFSDEILGTEEAQSGLADTMIDMSMNTLGALLAGAVYYFRRTKKLKR